MHTGLACVRRARACVCVCVCRCAHAACSMSSSLGVCQLGVCLNPGSCLFVLTYHLLSTSESSLLQSPAHVSCILLKSVLSSLQVNESEINDPNKPLSFGDFVEVVPCESPQLFAKHPAHLDSGNHLFPRPQHGKHRPPIEQQRQQLNSIYSLPSDDQHSPTNMWRVSSTELTTPPQRHGGEARRPVPSA